MIAAVYIVYGPRTEMVTAYKNNIRHYTWRHGRFKELEQITIGEKGKLNAPGGTQQHWPAHHKRMVDGLFSEGYRLRYSGGMVPDLHQILLKGKVEQAVPFVVVRIRLRDGRRRSDRRQREPPARPSLQRSA